MFDPITLDQLRVLVSVATEGSFSAAARRLQRVQSAVSTQMANLEAQLDVPLWDRTTKIPTLTPAGLALLSSARRVLAEVDELRSLAAGMSRGVEPQVSLCVDALFPLDVLLHICAEFATEFPQVDLRIDIQVMSAVTERVLRGGATLGVVGPLGSGEGLERRALGAVKMIPVVGPSHPLAKHEGPVGSNALRRAVQIVLSERVDDGAPDQAVLSPRTWRVADLHTKHQMLRAGLGWGNLPSHLANDDLRDGRLVALDLVAFATRDMFLPLSIVHRSDTTIGPAHRWLMQRLDALCTAPNGPMQPLAPQAGEPARRRKPSRK